MQPPTPYEQSLQSAAPMPPLPPAMPVAPAAPANGGQQAMPQPVVQPTPASAVPAAATTALQASAATAGVPADAGDNDLIEKEWVDQAKRVLTSHVGDPFVQNREFTKLKAEYMQKRYGKTVKTED